MQPTRVAVLLAAEEALLVARDVVEADEGGAATADDSGQLFDGAEDNDAETAGLLTLANDTLPVLISVMKPL